MQEIEIDDLDAPEAPLERMLSFVRACEEDGIGKTEGYRRIATGEWAAYRDGSRKVLISARSILARRKRFVRKITPGARKGLYRQPPILRKETAA